MSFIQVLGIPVLRNIPEVLAWGVGIVLAVIMIRRGGGRAEKLLLAGCGLMFVALLASPLLINWVQSLTRNSMTNADIALRVSLFVGIPTAVLGLAGLVCLIWGFWIRFRKTRQVAT